ncbi:MAG: Bifunctional protein HldE [Acidobacteria bacterium ADurb.Bin340]|nr:MAG: Bifunctional protein HldE [Acidobacteria bacterium ADurb.Bin340]
MRLERSRAKGLLDRLKGRKVVVLGDLMLDEYLFGEVNRISPEAPVPIVRVLRERAVLGGAANVAANLKAIGAEPVLVGTFQNDTAGRRLLDLLVQQEIPVEGLVLDSSRPTIIKTRIMGQQQQMLRLDREEPGPMDGEAIEGLVASLERAVSEAGAVVVSDYAKGVVGEEVLGAVRDLCGATGIPWIVDPKPAHGAFYRGASLLTPNTRELAELAGQPAWTDEEVVRAGARLMEALELGGVLVTRSERGMALLDAASGSEGPWLIPTEAREVFDVSGAGDTVVAVCAAAIAAGADWKDAAMLANAAAGLVVGKMGTATVTPAELLGRYQEQQAN